MNPDHRHRSLLDIQRVNRPQWEKDEESRNLEKTAGLATLGYPVAREEAKRLVRQGSAMLRNAGLV